MAKNKSWVRYLTTTALGFGWGFTPVEAYEENPCTIGDNGEPLTCSTYEITSSVPPASMDVPNPHWDIFVSPKEVESNVKTAKIKPLNIDY